MTFRPPGPWRATLSGLCASLTGVGLARFAYTPLIPVLITAQWFTAAQVVYLGAANLAGYLAGAILGRIMVERLPAFIVLRANMLLATASFFACAAAVAFSWFFFWRFAAGLVGGVLMVVAAPTVLPHVAPERRGLAGGVVFTGVGLGIALSGTLVPALLQAGLALTWCALGVLSLALTLLAWSGWPTDPPRPRPRVRNPGVRHPGAPQLRPVLLLLYLTYALNAAGAVPHMVFLVDFVARGLDQGLAGGARSWVLFGLGALAGALLAGRAADRIGFRPMLRLAFLVQAGAIVALALAPGPWVLQIASLFLGAFVPGVVPLVLGRVQELIPGDAPAQQAAWSFATTGFALGQAVSAYGYSFLFAHGSGYAILFWLGAAAMLLALLLDLLSSRLAKPHRLARPSPKDYASGRLRETPDANQLPGGRRSRGQND
jgi:predicted MFS family arabinose efflux permease